MKAELARRKSNQAVKRAVTFNNLKDKIRRVLDVFIINRKIKRATRKGKFSVSFEYSGSPNDFLEYYVNQGYHVEITPCENYHCRWESVIIDWKDKGSK